MNRQQSVPFRPTNALAASDLIPASMARLVDVGDDSVAAQDVTVIACQDGAITLRLANGQDRLYSLAEVGIVPLGKTTGFTHWSTLTLQAVPFEPARLRLAAAEEAA